jgi:hypothetical protein
MFLNCMTGILPVLSLTQTVLGGVVHRYDMILFNLTHNTFTHIHTPLIHRLLGAWVSPSLTCVRTTWWDRSILYIITERNLNSTLWSVYYFPERFVMCNWVIMSFYHEFLSFLLKSRGNWINLIFVSFIPTLFSKSYAPCICHTASGTVLVTGRITSRCRRWRCRVREHDVQWHCEEDRGHFETL